MLIRFGFEDIEASLIFRCDVMDHNVRSLKAAKKVGFEIEHEIIAEDEKKYKYKYDFKIRRNDFK